MRHDTQSRRIPGVLVAVCALLALLAALGAATAPAGAKAKWTVQTLPAAPDTGVYGAATRLTCVCFVDARHGWAGGDSGVLYRTVDGGAHWLAARYASAATAADGYDGFTITGFAFADTQVGWATVANDDDRTDNFIIGTSDGGASWRRVTPATSTFPYLTAISTTDATHAWAVGEKGTILALHDGVWQQQTSGIGGSLVAVCFVGPKQGWAVTSGFASDAATLCRTTDGGATWTHERLGCRGTDISFVNARHGFLLAGTQGVFATTDGGRTWKRRTLDPAASRLGYNSVDFRNANDGWAVGQDDNQVMRTTDGGRHFHVDYSYPVPTFLACRLVDIAAVPGGVWTVGLTASHGPLVVHAAE